MNYTVLDIADIYRRLLATPDPAAQTALFADAIITPFAPVFALFGGDAAALSRQWGLFTPADLDLTGAAGARLAALLAALTEYGAWQQVTQALADSVQAFADYRERIPLAHITAALLPVDAARTLPGTPDYAGFGALPGWLMVTVTRATAQSLPRLKAAAAHEMHHNLAGAAGQPMNGGRSLDDVTVAEYIIGEGLAEAFAVALYGEDVAGPWTVLPPAQMERARRLIGAALDVRGFGRVRRYIFGDLGAAETAESIPPYAGYCIGYQVVRAYCRRTGHSVVEATFVPPADIIAAAGYFEG